jgi:hypothetical protein
MRRVIAYRYACPNPTARARRTGRTPQVPDPSTTVIGEKHLPSYYMVDGSLAYRRILRLRGAPST